MNGIKPIETIYSGYRFRSRLEARWALFLEQMNVAFSYEPEGYDLGQTGWYLPDFWLHREEVFLEIKPRMQETVWDKKCHALRVQTGFGIILLAGNPWPGEYSITAFLGGEPIEALSFAESWEAGQKIKGFKDDGRAYSISNCSDSLKVAYQMARGARF